jgi:hypothetical protein
MIIKAILLSFCLSLPYLAIINGILFFLINHSESSVSSGFAIAGSIGVLLLGLMALIVFFKFLFGILNSGFYSTWTDFKEPYLNGITYISIGILFFWSWIFIVLRVFSISTVSVGFIGYILSFLFFVRELIEFAYSTQDIENLYFYNNDDWIQNRNKIWENKKGLTKNEDLIKHYNYYRRKSKKYYISLSILQRILSLFIWIFISGVSFYLTKRSIEINFPNLIEYYSYIEYLILILVIYFHIKIDKIIEYKLINNYTIFWQTTTRQY